ncbi:TIGR04255 family protein [Aeromonas caviae]|uniref:TIGR04255 family protein n=1 Tax=Aeromonas caviae TaxID=648 RepID=UPI0029DB9421|nr:TIGR04255 family protein [Aeromonas caviae]MDX7797972.1 TIGR04255 family protein [Aeromonas caviae]
MTEKLSNAPIYYALAQAQFNHIGAMHRYVNEVQDQLRKNGYVLFETQQSTQLEMGPNVHEPQVNHTITWVITNRERTAGYVIGPSFITYHTTHYTTKDDFIPELIRGIEAVHSVVNLDHVDRLGIRYLDAVLPKVGESIEQYLVEGVCGPKHNGNKRFGISESVYNTDTGPMVSNGTLISRVYQTTSVLGIPGDLSEITLVPMERFKPDTPIKHAVIDTDHFVEGNIPLRFDLLDMQLRNMHKISSDSFKNNVKKYALESWA